MVTNSLPFVLLVISSPLGSRLALWMLWAIESVKNDLLPLPAITLALKRPGSFHFCTLESQWRNVLKTVGRCWEDYGEAWRIRGYFVHFGLSWTLIGMLLWETLAIPCGEGPLSSAPSVNNKLFQNTTFWSGLLCSNKEPKQSLMY